VNEPASTGAMQEDRGKTLVVFCKTARLPGFARSLPRITIRVLGATPELGKPFGIALELFRTSVSVGRSDRGIILRSDGSGAFGGGTYDIIGPTGTSLGYKTVAAKAGDSVVLFAVGLGPTNPPVAPGAAYTGSAATTNKVNVLINNVSVAPGFFGETSAGLYQLNLTIPPGLGTGDVPFRRLSAACGPRQDR
jgi:hypothetical protein